jgi:AcrR family transcriptional regulator
MPGHGGAIGGLRRARTLSAMTAETETDAPARGRRRGRPRASAGVDRRAAILRAATAEFAENGYDATSLRAVARRAGVDAALVHHYFEDKAELLAAVVEFPVRPDKAIEAILSGPREEIGAAIVRFVTTQLEDRRRRQRAVALVRSAVSNKPVGQLAKTFVLREVVARLAEVADGPDPQLRAALAASQVVGLILARYVIELDPLAGASPAELVDRVAPVIQHHLFGP